MNLKGMKVVVIFEEVRSTVKGQFTLRARSHPAKAKKIKFFAVNFVRCEWALRVHKRSISS